MKIIFYGDSLIEGKSGVSFFNILRSRLNEHELVNFGKGGDTVISLYRRIKENALAQPCDLAFLWIGTNDVLVKASKIYPLIKTMLNKPWSKDQEEFKNYYNMILNLLSSASKRVITVPPIFVGEDLDTEWNRELKELSDIIRRSTISFKNAEYLDLRRIFEKGMASRKPSSYMLKSIGRLMMDVGLDTPEKVNKKSAERGLYFTLDGVHLNEKGAEIVANEFFRTIKNQKDL